MFKKQFPGTVIINLFLRRNLRNSKRKSAYNTTILSIFKTPSLQLVKLESELKNTGPKYEQISNLFAPEELQSRVAVAEKMRPSQDPTFLHWKPYSGQDLKQGQEPRSVLQVVDQALNFEWRTPLNKNTKNFNFINILLETFSYKSALHSFSLVTV